MANGALSVLPYFGQPAVGPLPNPQMPTIQPRPKDRFVSMPSTPNFQDIISSLNNPNRQIGGQATFERGVQAAQPFNGISPETQHILDMIRDNQIYNEGRGVAAANSLSLKRGVPGSSMEQFGVQEAVGQAARAAQDARANVLLENLKRNQALQDLQARGFFERAGQEGQIGANLGINEANLTSDEIASNRNLALANRSLDLQQLLGQQGIDVARQNIGAQRDINKENALYGLLGSIGGAATPYALSRLFGAPGGGGGVLGGLLGSSAASTGGGLVGQAFNPAGGAAASSLFPGGLGPVGTGVPAAGGAGIGLGGALGIAGAGLGAMALANYGKQMGGDVGAFFANPIGAQLNLAKSAVGKVGDTVQNIGNKVSNAVSKVFPF